MLKGWLRNMKLLVDANFLIDYYARRDEFFDSCTTLLVAESFHDVELWAPAKSFTDVFYVESTPQSGEPARAESISQEL